MVFGAGRLTARVMLLGEQPGNEEDLRGKPFVGAAGRLLDRALADAGIDRTDAYVTNVVKHFKWERRGKNRIHKKPSADDIRACRPWLSAELELVKPQVLVCLGATAAQAILGRSFRVTAEHGRVLSAPMAQRVVATLHPAAALRMPTSDDRRRALEQVIEDLRVVRQLLA